jgi:hypothetical protein
MTCEDLLDILRKISYKPGVRVRVRKSQYGAEFRINEQVTCSRTGKKIKRSAFACVPLNQCRAAPDPEGYVIEWVRSFLKDYETHEVDEWLKVGGKMIFDPHAAPDSNALRPDSTAAGYRIR